MTQFKNASSYTYSPGYTFPGNLPTELFRKPSIGTPPLSDIFQLRQGIRYNEWLVLVGQLEKILKAATGCNPTYTTSGTFSDRNIEVARYGLYHQWCKTDFMSTASSLSNDPSFVADGLDGYDVTAKVRSVWMDEMIDAIRRDYWRILFMSNSTAGNADYNTQDGVFARLFDAFGSYCVKPILNTLPNQFNSVLSTDQALTALKAVHTGAPIILKQIDPSQKHFITTGTIYENLLESYESKSSGTETQFKLLTDGTTRLFFRGIEVVPLYILDNYFEDSANPWYNNLRHPIIYTTKGTSKFANHVIGTERGSDLDRIDMFFDQKDLVTYAQHESVFGYNFIHCDLTAFAY